MEFVVEAGAPQNESGHQTVVHSLRTRLCIPYRTVTPISMPRDVNGINRRAMSCTPMGIRGSQSTLLKCLVVGEIPHMKEKRQVCWKQYKECLCVKTVLVTENKTMNDTFI